MAALVTFAAADASAASLTDRPTAGTTPPINRPLAGKAPPIKQPKPVRETPDSHREFATGGVIVLPGAPVPPQKEDAVIVDTAYHVIAENETLYAIARRYYGSASAQNINRIIRANPKLKANPDYLVPGETLVIPLTKKAVKPKKDS